MDFKFLGRKTLSMLLAMNFIVAGCLSSDVPSKRKTTGSSPGTSTPDSRTTNPATSLPPKVEIRHLIEPNLSADPNYSSGTGHAGGGSYVRKLTLPKNFAGRLYVAGINIGTLANRHVKVRFKFGYNREPVVIPATVTQAPGITPQTGIDVLVLDMKSEPFRNVRLPYDLYDYNVYGTDANGDPIPPVQNNRDSELYCRGLRIEDDSTFVGVGACDGKTQTGVSNEKCLYAYAKVLDQGLVQEVPTTTGTVYLPLTPSRAQVKSISGNEYYRDYMEEHLKKPLLDSYSPAYIFSKQEGTPAVTNAVDFTFEDTLTTSFWDPLNIGGSNYYYQGPYRLINRSEWEYKFEDITGEFGIFSTSIPYPDAIRALRPLPDDPSQKKIYFNSLMFPLATKLDLNASVSYLGSDDTKNAYDTRIPRTTTSAGKSEWMDGANARAQSRNAEQEHIGSCNVSATIEIIAKDDNNNEYVISVANDVKIQLVRPTQHRTDTGNEVLYSNFKSCSSNSACGSNECCFNNRCWDQSLTSQCLETNQGNREIGQACVSDMQCSSLCCNRTSGLCSPHNTLLSPAVLCSKPIGDFCIAKEWCQKSPVVKCLVVKTGTDAAGNVTCRQQCYTSNEYGDCKAGVCVPPVQAPIPTFDPSAPDACANAVPAPSF